ncbi:ATP-binding cassette subfamily B protein [Enterobacter sp. BIGb0383]|uniref:ABC transporter ATP-binding protein n=1 Tax=unclassified Enterobacter TaxID=2608935 RepID=UPI000F47CEFA|nr:MULTISPECIES: ABC transporter ATP-binding protein [unclassified Enterobacter]ROP58165.1 ATP-binding cassette subfamily B protein [Enterobacter sp. BIGb0383]ROS06947.1 ATP-binding cassette subfamily B protein [Enterobacter sp. BIGb0359]
MTTPDQRLIHTFWPYIRRQRRLISGSFATLMLATLLRLLEPWPLSFAIDLIMAEMAGKKMVTRLPGTESWGIETWLWACAISVIAIATLKAAISYLSTIGLAIAGSRVMSEVRRDLFTHLLRLPLAFHRQARVGDLALRLSNDIGMLREVTVTAMMPLLSSIVMLLGMFGVMLYIDWDLTLIALLPIPVLLWSTRKSGQKIRDVSRAQRKREGKLAAKATEYMGGIATVQALSLEEATRKSFSGDDTRSMQQNVEVKRLSAGLERRVELLIAFATAIVLLDGTRDVLDGSMTPGNLLIFLSYLKNAFRPIREYAKYTGRLAKALTAGERITDLLAQQPAMVDRPDAVMLGATTPAIRWQDVRFSYQDAARETGVLCGVSFDIPAGQSVAIVGPSGAGKSTLSSLLLRLYSPDSGQILIDGKDISHYTTCSIRQQTAYVPQENLLFGVTVRENILLAAHAEVSEEAMFAAARLANAHDFILALPEGYDTVISERGSSLSGGQRQRIAIARAAIRDSPILVLDEPSVGLDSHNEHLVIDALLRLMRTRTTLVITHNLAFAARTDHIVLLEQGRIAEQGSHEALLALNGHYAGMWRLQQHSQDVEQKQDEYA